jgi:hypothetical protein
MFSRPGRRMLREEVTSGRLAAAESKAQLLEGLCDRLNFDAEAAAALHKSLYRQKLETLLEKKQLSGSKPVLSIFVGGYVVFLVLTQVGKGMGFHPFYHRRVSAFHHPLFQSGKCRTCCENIVLS